MLEDTARRCVVCGKLPSGSEKICIDCETPLPELPVPKVTVSERNRQVSSRNRPRPKRNRKGNKPNLSSVKPARKASRSRKASRVVATVLLLLILGLTGGVLVASMTASSPTQMPEEVSSPRLPMAGECLDVHGYELRLGAVQNLGTRVVSCNSDKALVKIFGAEDDCSNCLKGQDSEGNKLRFMEIPHVGNCFYGYVASSGKGSGYPFTSVPCDEPPSEDWLEEMSTAANEKWGVPMSDIRFVTFSMTQISNKKISCDKGQSLWGVENTDPAYWICAKETATHR